MEIDELKKELAELEGKTEQVQAVPEAQSAASVFDSLLAGYRERQEREARENAEAKNATLKSCGDCYFVQPVIQATCELCGAVPLTWLPAAEYPENRELDSLRTMATEYTIEQLNIALRSGWCSNRPERERVARNILAARIRLRDIQEVREKVAAATKAYDQESSRQPELPPKEKVRELTAVYDRQAAEIRRQIEALESGSR